ncbi:MAG: glycosyltransferase family 39 protein [Bryobacterales bacterium]
MGSLSFAELACLWGLLSIGLLLRVVALDWGLPPATPEVAASGIRSSYAIDENNVLENLARTDPARFDIDPRFYGWGTLHLELVLAALEAAQAVGVFETPWRDAYARMVPGEFEKVYVTGRLVSVFADLVTVFLVFLLGAQAAGKRAGLWAAGLVAFAPGHLLQASQIRPDVTATMLVTLVVLLASRWIEAARPKHWFALGLAAGLAVSAKYSMALIVGAVLAFVIWKNPRRPVTRWALAGVIVGFLLGEPFVLTNYAEVARQVGLFIRSNLATPAEFLIPKPILIAQHLAGLSRFSLGIPGMVLAVFGLWALRRSPKEFALISVALAAGLVSLLPQNWPLMRYHLPLVPLCAVAAAAGIVALPRWGGPAAGALALAFALAASVAQVRFMLYPHPANLALAIVQRAVPPGETVARIMPETPPLDAALYPMGPNPLMDDLTLNPPPWVITSELPIMDYPEANQRLLNTRYEPIAVVRSQRIFAWATLGESGAPHDWKYTHASMTVYRLR